MSLAEKFSILVLVLSAAAQLKSRFFFSARGRSAFGGERYVKLVFYLSIFAQFASAFYLSFSQYEVWKTSQISVFLLPPYRDLSYFIYYVSWRIFSPIILALFFAVILKFSCEFLNRRLGERFLEPEESWLLALGVFLTGYPGFLFYIPLMLLVAFFLSIIYHFMKKGRAPLFYAWLPVAIFAILLKSLIPQAALNFLII